MLGVRGDVQAAHGPLSREVRCALRYRADIRGVGRQQLEKDAALAGAAQRTGDGIAQDEVHTKKAQAEEIPVDDVDFEDIAIKDVATTPAGQPWT